MARAKQTGRAEARRRYRQATAAEEPETEAGAELDFGERRPDAAPKAPAKPTRGTDRTPTGRVGVFDSFRLAYHPVNIRDDLRAIP